MTSEIPPLSFRAFYDRFNASITDIDCGEMCVPHNPNGIPFCCDICTAVPAGFITEWDYLREHTDLWHIWRGGDCADDADDPEELWNATPDHMLLMACKGTSFCEREYRAISCRQFPFFPYLTSKGEFLGLAYEWNFEEKCWVLSNLHQVTDQYRREFVELYDELLQLPQEQESYRMLSAQMRNHFIGKKRSITLLHRDGGFMKIDPQHESVQAITTEELPKFGVYQQDNHPFNKG